MFRRVLTAAAVSTFAAAGILVGSAAPASASFCRIGTDCMTYYYADSSHSKVVGWKNVTCDGTVFSGGRTTAYFTVDVDECPYR